MKAVLVTALFVTASLILPGTHAQSRDADTKQLAVPAGPVFRSDGVLEFLAVDKPSLYRIEVTDF